MSLHRQVRVAILESQLGYSYDIGQEEQLAILVLADSQDEDDVWSYSFSFLGVCTGKTANAVKLVAIDAVLIVVTGSLEVLATIPLLREILLLLKYDFL